MKNLIMKYFPNCELKKKIHHNEICYYVDVTGVEDAIERQAALLDDPEYYSVSNNQQFGITFLMVATGGKK